MTEPDKLQVIDETSRVERQLIEQADQLQKAAAVSDRFANTSQETAKLFAHGDRTMPLVDDWTQNRDLADK